MLDEEARGIFQGKIIVSPGAQKTDGKQMAQALLLSETAEFDSKPELEIFADDVVCGHGATSGQIDEDLLFYLESRGLPEPEARAMLIQAFVGEAFEQVEDEKLARRVLRRSPPMARRPRSEGSADDHHHHPSAKDLRAMEAPFDLDAIRADFPILSETVHGKPLTYLDNGASAQKPRQVIEAVSRAYGHEYANVHRGLHHLSNVATANFEKAREKVRGFLNARSPTRRSSSPATPPSRSTSSLRPSGARASARATRSCSPSWSTTPTSCPGISSASGKARF